MKPRYLLGLFVIPLGLIIAAVPQNTTHPYKLTADKLLEEATGKAQFVSPDNIAEMIIQKDPVLQLIDVRTPDEFEKFSLPGAINIPLANLLAPEFTELLNQDLKMNVFISNGTLQSSQAWLITRQLGYQNNYILQGGLNYWAETIMNPGKPVSTNPDDEIARYDFRKGASMALGGGALQTTQPSNGIKVPSIPIIKKENKKKVQGGC
jgi:sulfur-carrier protein adenylyltransferase/sulfurtransferase